MTCFHALIPLLRIFDWQNQFTFVTLLPVCVVYMKICICVTFFYFTYESVNKLYIILSPIYFSSPHRIELFSNNATVAIFTPYWIDKNLYIWSTWFVRQYFSVTKNKLSFRDVMFELQRRAENNNIVEFIKLIVHVIHTQDEKSSIGNVSLATLYTCFYRS